MKNTTEVLNTPQVIIRTVAIQLISIAAILLIASLASRYYFQTHFLEHIEHQIFDTIGALAPELYEYKKDPTMVHALPIDWCKKRAPENNIRLSLIDAKSGRIFCDSFYGPADLEEMPSLLEKPEIQEAIQGGIRDGARGFSHRFSSTRKHQSYYGVQVVDRKPNPFIIRVGIPLEDLTHTLAEYDRSVLKVILVVFLIALGIVLINMRLLRKPIEKLQAKLDQQSETFEAERREHEAILGSISEAVLAVDANGTALFYNANFLTNFGTFLLSDLSFGPELQLLAKQVFLTGSVHRSKQIQYKNNQYYIASASPLKNRIQHTYGVLFVFYDISEIKSYEQKQVEFVANASHELRTPLTSIRGYTETLLMDAKENRPVEIKFLQVIQKNCDRLLSLIQDLMRLEQPNDHQMTTLNEVIEKIRHVMEPLFQTKSQTFSIEAIPETVTALDVPANMDQVLINLLTNAHRYTPEHTSVTLQVADVHKSIQFTVADNGPGIPSEHHAHLFDRFYRVDKARSRKEGGSGLGLAITKQIIENYGGTIALKENSPHQPGATFVVSLPTRT